MALTTGARLGPYEIVSHIGAGGMGEVYLAHDTRLGRRVAIKALLRESPAGLPTPHQLFQEARAAAALTHPHIAAIHDVIEFDGRPMIVMEYVSGQSLDAYVRAERPSIDQVIEWGLQIADALGAAHAHDVIHCDIKPANIRVTPEGAIKILDFGVARIRSVTTSDSRPASETTTARAPGIVGTPPYMAPEQFLSQPVDPRTDLYAAGVVLFELLAGRRPFEAPDTVGLSQQVLSGPTPVVTDLNPAVPAPLARVVSRAMARRPVERYQSAAAFAEALREARTAIRAGHLPIERVGSTVRVASMRTRSVWTGVLAFTGAAAMVTGAAWTWGSRKTPPDTLRDPVVAILPLANLSGESQNDYLSAGLTDVATTKLAGLPGARVLSASATSGYRDGTGRIDRVAQDLGATLVVEGSLQRSGDRVQVTANLVRAGSRQIVWSGTFSAAVDDIFNLQRQLTDGLIQGLQTAGALTGSLTTQDLARAGSQPTTNVEAFADYAQGRSFIERRDVPGNLDRAVSLLESAVARDARFALAHAALGEAYWLQYQKTREPSWIARAREEALEALRLDPNQAGVRYSLAVIYNGTGKTSEAIDELQRAMALQPSGDEARRLLGEILATQGDLEAAAVQLRRAVDLRPSYWSNHWSLGLAFYNAGRYQEAIPSFRRVTELQPDNARGFQTLGTAYHQLNDLANALTNYQRAIALSPSSAAYSNIGTIYFGRAQFAEAARAYQSAIGLSPLSATTHRNLANAFEALGQKSNAGEAYTKAVQLTTNTLRVNPDDARTLALRAYCEAKLGATTDAQRDIHLAQKLAPTDKEVLYKKALITATVGDEADALRALTEALAHGYSASLVTTDREWLRLQSSAEFQRLVTTR